MEKLKRQDLEEDIAIIKINKSYKEKLSDLELYDITRGCWKRKLESVENARYVLAVAFSVVKEVYKVDKWMPSEELNRETIEYHEEDDAGRIGFSGDVAPNDIRNKYIGKSVADLYKKGEADPVKVFLVDSKDSKKSMDINIAIEPKKMNESAKGIVVTCPNCEYIFNKAKRCPVCGQLIKYEGDDNE